ncbi:ABC transporter ATP-binding protein [Anoxybacteroides amylolyticum]|uniref:ABC transporter family protein n=1 Tax=Anoxybacteroides amylolyticum TaxID=294699 RepID=A0A167TJ28_9BACL|nr:ABC transporter ATP-binding protein [Anoxybacillus amylolyticus]ANB61010.1 ABC transporter family protein [Anoxybacillus amylolyticus]
MIIEMENVSFIREDRVILDRIHWKVQENEQWVILGLNGSGKTSLLNIVLGYEYPSKGEVSVLGHRFGKTNLPELRKHIGFVSSTFERFQPTLESETVEEVVVSGKFASIGLYEPVTDEDQEQAEQWMDLFRIGHLKGKAYRTLSQGEKRKVLLARALMAKPKLLILDEPTVGLDMLTREELLALIKDVIATKICHVLYVTHYVEEIIEEMTHVLLLKDGKIVAAGPKEKLLTDDYLSETFQMVLHVRWEHNRPWISIKNIPTLQRLGK